MMALKRRKKIEPEEVAKKSIDILHKIPIDIKYVISTGSTLLDLAILGGRRKGGGLPAGMLVEIYGKSGSGKTALLVEAASSAQFNGGDVQFQDPEARLDKEYTRIYGLKLNKDNYHRPKYISELFKIIDEWETDPNHINVIAADSLAAFSTETEMTDGDKRGQLRAKEFSTGTRKMALKLAEENRLVLCSNQIRQGDYGDITPGGKAIEFYSSLRIQMKQLEKVMPEKTIRGIKQKRVIGVKSECFIAKNSVGVPYRSVPIYIMFQKGIDDVRANLQWFKDNTKGTMYNAVDKEYKRLEDAIRYVEDNDLEQDLRDMVIDLWEEIEDKFEVKIRKEKKRFKL